jgi:F-type H+-transporting ATPase subunit alpha
MEARIRRGRVLREILKQEHLHPLPVEFQLAWLVAFNEGLLDHVELDAVPGLLDQLDLRLRDSNLTLDDDHATWAQAVSAWLPPKHQETTT